MVQASRYDSITTVFTLEDIHDICPDFHFKNFITDGVMDNYPTYKLLKHYDILPFISLDSRTKAKFDYPHPDILCFDDKGNPICMGGILFYNWGYSKPKEIKYHCYFATKGLQLLPECKCSDSNYVKVIYIKSDYDPRIFPPVSCNSEKFKGKFKTRTSVECSNKHMFIDYAIEEYSSRSAMMRIALANFFIINIHLDAWIKRTHIFFQNFQLLFDYLLLSYIIT